MLNTARIAATLGAMTLANCGAGSQADPQREGQRSVKHDTLPTCEWCGTREAPATLTNSMTLAAPNEPGQRFVVTGTVYFADRTTPAPQVLLYAYQTNAAGVYANRATQRGNGQRHGALRGWLRTDEHGRYRIVTIKPGPYPGRPDPAHIHMTVEPPNGPERYIDDVMFADDPRLTPTMAARNDGRGGPGVVTPWDSAGILRATRDIWLSEAPSRAMDLHVDLAQSVVAWKGTKFRGRGSHSGVVPLKSGILTQCGTDICGGHFALDMTRIQVTDIPATDPIPRNRLTEHLKSADFFASDQFPAAQFHVSSVQKRGRDGQYMVGGQLTLRASTQPIRFPATVSACGSATCINADIAIDRRRWGITYRFDPIRNLLVDDTIAITLHLVVTTRDQLAVTTTRGRPGDAPMMVP